MVVVPHKGSYGCLAAVSGSVRCRTERETAGRHGGQSSSLSFSSLGERGGIARASADGDVHTAIKSFFKLSDSFNQGWDQAIRIDMVNLTLD